MKYLFTHFLWFSCLTVYAQLTIVVDQIPDNTPTDANIHIAGNFQEWNPSSTDHILTKDEASGNHSITFPEGLDEIQFKFTRGSWATVETDANGEFIDDRTYEGNEGDSLHLQILGWEDLFTSCDDPPPGGTGESTAAENVEIFDNSFYMPQFDRCRRIWVYLPPDYETSGKSYPVLYMHDGQNVFDASTSFISEWEVDETLNRLHTQGDEGVIVVGIDNGQQFRTQEYIPWKEGLFSGRGDEYMEFIVETLKPAIDEAYRTKPDRANTALMGSSFGGVISTFGGIEYQNVFSRVGAFSTSYWVSEEIYTHAETTGKQADMRIYQLMGHLEGDGYVEAMHRMEEVLHNAGFEEDEVLSVDHADGQHSEWYWAREFEAAYIWLFEAEIEDVEVPTSLVDDAKENQAFALYPNPSNDALKLSFELMQPAEVQVEIYDFTGKQVFKNSLQTTTIGLQEVSINTSLFETGVYVCRLRINEEYFSKSFSVVR